MTKKRYIIALLAKDPAEYIRFAQTNFASIAENYLLSEHAHPHITLVQFYGEEADYIRACEYLSHTKLRPQPRFTGIQFGQDGSDAGILWANITVARDAELLTLHACIVDILQEHNLIILNDIKDLYYPHVTFARIRAKEIVTEKPTIIPQRFDLAIGVADDFGQFVEVTKMFNYEALHNEQMQKVFAQLRV
jgi:2'-5' RNA ligase